MEPILRHVLVLGVDDPSLERVAPMLHRAEFIVHRLEPSTTALEVLRSSSFDLVIAAYPLPELPVETLHTVLRSQESGSRHAGFLLLCDPDHVDNAYRYVDRGVNRAVAVNWNASRFWQAMADLLDVAPRISMCAPVNLEIVVGGQSHTRLCQTGNISRTGMLLLGDPIFEAGTDLGFSLSFPDDPEPVQGEAEVVRSTDMKREDCQGFAVRFLSFRGDGQYRLEGYIEEQLREEQEMFWREFTG